ncbi:hydroxyethylthiazole kinase [Kineosporia mesophila]|uniref:Hydroxyethylthiazole kinase n=1 Tax=Kineosporia mesophila TaxID=566012 RepID=A0ABP7ATN8_9ACTN|nr:hydroxyethylthiazole kinase [Kineosporia mesophila]MCD5352366.1 hydroxyethylthiazole kinase [Kineosporia mesophila]
MTTQIRWPDPYVTGPLRAVVEASPLVFGLTNYITAGLNANMVLAVGGSPAIGGNPAAVEPLATAASGVWINLAAMVTDTPELLLTAARTAHDAGTRWVLDPVTVGAGIPVSDDLAAGLITTVPPTAVRGNASEVIALAGGTATSRGVDATATPEDAVPYAKDLARRTGAVIAISGPTDYVTDGSEVIAVPGGHRWLTKVTGAGCSLGALVATFLAPGTDPLRATVAAHAALAVAAERAVEHARGTGTFAAAVLDELTVLAEGS